MQGAEAEAEGSAGDPKSLGTLIPGSTTAFAVEATLNLGDATVVGEVPHEHGTASSFEIPRQRISGLFRDLHGEDADQQVEQLVDVNG
jgi:hypothetical protein